MRPADYVINLVLSGVLIVGAYQFYFWCQRNAPFEAREFGSFIDDRIPYVPGWVWVYSFLYYPAILYVNLVLESPEQFTQVASSYMLLLALQLPCFLVFPVCTPLKWRVPPESRTLSERYLAFVQRFDDTLRHGMRFLEDPGVRLAKIEGNPFHETVREIARRAGLRFCLNVVTDDRERVVAVAAGDPDAVLADLVAKAGALYTRPIANQYDIVIAGVGHPKDVNLYQASRAATYLRFAPTPVVREGGAIIIPARLEEGAGEGAGEQRFLAALERAESPAAVVEAARRHFAGGEQRAVMVALTLQWCQIIVAASEAPEVVRLAKLRAAVDVEEGLDIAYEHIGRPTRASVLLVPRALHTLPVVESGVVA